MKIRPKSTKPPFREEDVDALIANFGRTPAQKEDVVQFGKLAVANVKIEGEPVILREDDELKVVDDDEKKSD